MALFGHSSYKDPSKAAQPYLDKAEGATRSAYDPYIERGNRAGGVLEDEYSNMLDPVSYLNKLMGDYQPSAGYQYKQDQLSRSIGNTARAGGVAGSDEHQRRQSEMISGLLGDDMQQWLSNLLGIKSQGIKGYQGWDDQGYGASVGEGSDLSNLYGSEATLAYKGAEQNNSRHNDLVQGLMKLLGTAGGAALGGVPGAAVGSRLGGPSYDR